MWVKSIVDKIYYYEHEQNKILTQYEEKESVTMVLILDGIAQTASVLDGCQLCFETPSI